MCSLFYSNKYMQIKYNNYNNIHSFIHSFIHSSILPEERSFIAISGIKAAVLLKGRSFTANSGTQAAVLLGIDRCGSFPCFPHTTLSLASEQTLRDPRDTNVEVRRVDLVNWALRTSPKFTIGVKYQLNCLLYFILCSYYCWF